MLETVKFTTERDGKTIKGSGDVFDQETIDLLRDSYFAWKNINEMQARFNTRRLNVPESLTEGITAYLFNLLRTNATQISGLSSSSFDAINPTTGITYQIKACSSVEGKKVGPTSFGPRSEYDELIFVHVDCDTDKINFYMFNDALEDMMVNKTETFADQCNAGKRPRFSLYAKIIELGITPIMVYDLKGGMVVD